jgi:hypothetical protein
MADEPTEGQELALWCAALPSLRVTAARTGVLARLERDVARVRDGGSARIPVRKWLQDNESAPQRGWADRLTTGIAGIPGRQTRSVGVGEYACPLDRCERRAGRDGDGHVPTCAALDTVMRPAT